MKHIGSFHAAIILAAFVGISSAATVERPDGGKLAGSDAPTPTTQTKAPSLPAKSSSSAASPAAGVAAGSKADADNSASSPAVDAEKGKRQRDLHAAELKQTVDTEDSQKAALAQAQKAAAEAKRKAQQEAKRIALIEQENDRKRRLQEWEARCVIKPVMTDAEIATCREVWTRPPS